MQQLGVKFYKLLHRDFVDLQMTFLAATFLVHHPHKVAIPVGHFLFLLVVIVELAYIFTAYAPQVAAISAYDVFNLPHIKQILGYALLP